MGSAQEMLLLVELNTQIGISSKTAYVMSASVAVELCYFCESNEISCRG